MDVHIRFRDKTSSWITASVEVTGFKADVVRLLVVPKGGSRAVSCMLYVLVTLEVFSEPYYNAVSSADGQGIRDAVIDIQSGRLQRGGRMIHSPVIFDLSLRLPSPSTIGLGSPLSCTRLRLSACACARWQKQTSRYAYLLKTVGTDQETSLFSPLAFNSHLNIRCS